MSNKTTAPYSVACGFDGGIYSRHRTLAAARAAKNKLLRSWKGKAHLVGSLPGYVRIVPAGAYFGKIHDGRQVTQARWSEVIEQRDATED